jgi:hypothetical protein
VILGLVLSGYSHRIRPLDVLLDRMVHKVVTATVFWYKVHSFNLNRIVIISLTNFQRLDLLVHHNVFHILVQPNKSRVS